MTGWQFVLTSLIALMGASGVTELIRWLRERKSGQQVKVEAAERVNDMTLKWAQEVQEEAAAARAEAKHARDEVKHARAEMERLYAALRQARRELDAIAQRLTVVHQAIMSPGASLAGLRRLAQARYDATATESAKDNSGQR